MNRKSATILIADDDESLRRVLEFQLQEACYSVLTAENGSVAFEIFSNQGVDCLITDWRMPQMPCTAKALTVGLGGMATINTNPTALTPYYGGTTHGGWQIFMRFRPSKMTH